MTYSELQQSITDYMHRTDLAALIPGFIELARTRINRDLRVRAMLTTDTVTPVANPFAVPTDFLEMRDMYTTHGNYRVTLTLVGRKQLNQFQVSTGSPPQFYSIDGELIETSPGGIGILFNQTFYKRLAAFVNPTDTNDVLDRYPTIYLYGALIEAHTYTQDLDLVQQALGNYTSEVSNANAAAASAESGASLQVQGASQWI